MSTAAIQQTLKSFEIVHPPVPEVPTRPLAAIKKEFLDTIKQLTYSRHAWQVWQDFVELGAITIHNQLVSFDQELEDRYLNVIKNYDTKELPHFQNLLKLCFEALHSEVTDFLGQIFQELELASHWHGQFFTPYHLCKLMAQMNFDLALFDEKETVTVSEPSCGAGAMVLALCEHLEELEINYVHRMHVVCQDLDFTACCMAYIQLSIIGCSAHIVHGNTLTMETRQVFVTPAAAIYGRF